MILSRFEFLTSDIINAPGVFHTDKTNLHYEIINLSGKLFSEVLYASILTFQRGF